jgi:hypothetical protein
MRKRVKGPRVDRRGDTDEAGIPMKVEIKRDDERRGGTVATISRDTVISVLDDEGNVQSQVKLSSLTESKQEHKKRVEEIIEEEQRAPEHTLPDEPPVWAMPLHIHHETCQKTAVYRCLSCGGEHEEYRTNPRDLPYAKVCGCLVEAGPDGEIEKCAAPALRRVTLPGEGVALNARRFEPLVIYRSASDPSKFSFPGRNNEPTEAGYHRVEITNIHDYNKIAKEINGIENRKMSDHREMHRLYWDARRTAMRDHVNARIRHSPLLVSLARLIRSRSDRKSAIRYGKPLDARFHSQLLEFDQGHIQDYCDKDTGWKSTRAR